MDLKKEYGIEDVLLRELPWETPEGWEEVQEKTMVDKRRWETIYERVIAKKDKSIYLNIGWNEGNTEYQEPDLEITIDEVVPQEYTAIRYVLKKG